MAQQEIDIYPGLESIIDTLERKLVGERQPPSNTTWTIEIMAGAILGIKENDEPINPAYLASKYKRLREAINNYPGGWKRVVTLAGFNPDEETARARKIRKTL